MGSSGPRRPVKRCMVAHPRQVYSLRHRRCNLRVPTMVTIPTNVATGSVMRTPLFSERILALNVAGGLPSSCAWCSDAHGCTALLDVAS